MQKRQRAWEWSTFGMLARRVFWRGVLRAPRSLGNRGCSCQGGTRALSEGSGPPLALPALMRCPNELTPRLGERRKAALRDPLRAHSRRPELAPLNCLRGAARAWLGGSGSPRAALWALLRPPRGSQVGSAARAVLLF